MTSSIAAFFPPLLHPILLAGRDYFERYSRLFMTKSAQPQAPIQSIETVASNITFYQGWASKLYSLISYVYPKLWYFTAAIVTLCFLSRMGFIATLVVAGVPMVLTWECFACKETFFLINEITKKIISTINHSNESRPLSEKIKEDKNDLIRNIFNEKTHSLFFLQYSIGTAPRDSLIALISYFYPKLWYFTATTVGLYFLNYMSLIKTLILGGVPGVLAWECYTCKEALSVIDHIQNLPLPAENHSSNNKIKIVENNLNLVVDIFKRQTHSFFFLKFLPRYIVSQAKICKKIISPPR